MATICGRTPSTWLRMMINLYDINIMSNSSLEGSAC